MRILNCVGGCYVIFAIVTAMAAFEAHDTRASDNSQIVANTGAKTVWNSERLSDAEGNPRRDIWLTIWTTRHCPWCEIQKEEVPTLEKAGYNVIVRRAPAPRWVKGFPSTVVTKGSPTGPVLKRIVGYKRLAEFDTILGISWQPPKDPDAEPVDVPDYNITKGALYNTSLIVWVSNDAESIKQRIELVKLNPAALRLNLYFVTINPNQWPYNRSTPTVILLDNRGNSRVIKVWHRFVTVGEIRASLH